MYQILLWGVTLFLSVSVFITTFSGMSQTSEKRLLKQAVNLAGREIVNHIDTEGDSLHIREKSFVKAVAEQLRSDGFIACLFVYATYATAVDVSGEEAVPVFFRGEDETEKENQVNMLLQSLLPGDGQSLGIRFRTNTGRSDTAGFFSGLEESPAIFLVLRGKKYYTVSGYSLKTAGS